MADDFPKTHVPKFRFPEFRDDWKPGIIRQFLHKVVEPVDVEPDEQYRQIGVRSHGKGIFHKKAVSGSKLGEKRVFWVQPNALVINIVFAWEQALALTTDCEKGMIASHRFPMFLPVKGKSELNFVFHFFMRKRGKALLALASPGGAGRNKTLGQSEFMKLKVILPAAEEQKKIATFLSTVDAKLDALRREHLALSRYKAGLTQQLFRQTIRFKQAKATAFSDWRDTKISDILNLKYGKVQKTLRRGTIPVFGSGGIIRYTDMFLYNGPSVLIGRKGTINAPMYINGPFWAVDTMFYTEIADSYDPYFVYCLIRYIGLEKYAESTGVPSLSAGVINSLVVAVPSSPIEQTKIADAIRAFDTKLQAVADQLSKMEKYKNSLLQQMFV
jgi:type I restriction enzyme S subunit